MNLTMNLKLHLFLGIILSCLIEINVTAAAAAVGASRSEMDELYDLFGKEFVDLELKRLQLKRLYFLTHLQVDKDGKPRQTITGDVIALTPFIANYVKLSPKQMISEASKKDACDFVIKELKINVPDCQNTICLFEGITCDGNGFVIAISVKYIETDMKNLNTVFFLCVNTHIHLCFLIFLFLCV